MVENASRNCKSRPYGSRTAPTKNGARRSRPRFRVRLAARAVTGNRTPRDVNFPLATTGTCSRRNLGFAPCRWFNKARFATFPSLLFFSFPEKNTARESAREIRGICGGVNPFPYSSAPPDGQNSQVAGRYSQNNESAHQGAPRAHSRTRPAPGMGVGLKTPRFWHVVASGKHTRAFARARRTNCVFADNTELAKTYFLNHRLLRSRASRVPR